MGNKKPVRPRQPILTPLSQGIAPAYAGAASPGLTKPVNSKVKPALKRVKMKIVAYLVNSINYMHCLLLGPEIACSWPVCVAAGLREGYCHATLLHWSQNLLRPPFPCCARYRVSCSLGADER